MATTRRLPKVHPLNEILPKGTEGGKEFARIVDLLLFHEARQNGRKITVFNDAAGDYNGLDSFEGDRFRKDGTTGYQYKFFPTPLSARHRAEIKHSLLKAKERSTKMKLKKWILILPDDLTESATNNDGGDVSWFESLRTEHKINFETEAWGHTKLQSLFLKTPSLCLFYYPELIEAGLQRKKSLQDTRIIYDDNLHQTYGRIEFIGMSVYKEEATRGVPMEDIYIPLSAIPESAEDSGDNRFRTKTIDLLKPGARYVVLGDPGSGKSTLLKFLAMVGSSKPLQNRCGIPPDDRLPILISLRRYADELKGRPNLPLLDYAIEVTKADFSLDAADKSFFEYWLDAGRTILLFDGLDELPNPSFKEIIRNRIQNFVAAYPSNTTITTSRIVGYDSAFRFNDKKFQHLKLAKLQLTEIEQFIRDWYKIRIDNPKERDRNVNDLARIVGDPSHKAIRELAENPLLLTIVALVHRIDAVLPDERVVLYQKCTETLLNTWHKWKFRSEEEKHAGKTERRNRRRIEAIAYWMQCRAGETSPGMRAVVPLPELESFLAKHIETFEAARERTDEPQDLAKEFLEFIRKRAGLLIEVGDQRYSFVHLTFQEYLAATHIATISETGGFDEIWRQLQSRCDDPRWREVIRLLTAGLKSESSQTALLDRLTKTASQSPTYSRELLLGGLLLDGIGPAEEMQDEILDRLINAGLQSDELESLRQILSTLRAWHQKSSIGHDTLKSRFSQSLKTSSDAQKTKILLLSSSLGIPSDELSHKFSHKEASSLDHSKWLPLVIDQTLGTSVGEPIHSNINELHSLFDCLATTNPYGSLLSVSGLAVTAIYAPEKLFWRAFTQGLTTLIVGIRGPFSHLMFNILAAAPCTSNSSSSLAELNNHPMSFRKNIQVIEEHIDRLYAHTIDLEKSGRTVIYSKLMAKLPKSSSTLLGLSKFKEELDSKNTQLNRVPGFNFNPDTTDKKPLLSHPALSEAIADSYCKILGLSPTAHWRLALQSTFIPRIPTLLEPLTNLSSWEKVYEKLKSGKYSETDIFGTALLILFSIWRELQGIADTNPANLLNNVVERARTIDAAPLTLALWVRDMILVDQTEVKRLPQLLASTDSSMRGLLKQCNWIEDRLGDSTPKHSLEKKNRP